MNTSAEIEFEFKEKLRNLLNEYKAEINVEEDNNSGLYYVNPWIRITIPTVYDADGEVVSEFTEINLGSYFECDEK